MDDNYGTDSIKFGDQHKSDVAIHLKNNKGRQELFHSHSFVLKTKSSYFADKLSDPTCPAFIEILCTDLDYDHHIKLLNSLYLPLNSLLESWDSVRSTLGVLQVATTLQCETIINSCVQYLEAVPWEDSEEDDIVRVVSQLGPVAMSILARVQPSADSVIKSVFISAIRFATSVSGPCPPFGDELRTSAQEQVEYMLGDEESNPSLASDKDVKSETIAGLSNTFSLFESGLSLLLECDEASSSKIMQSLCDLEWMCNLMLRMGLMVDFVSKWIHASEKIVQTLKDEKFEGIMWDFKLKLLEVSSKVLDAVGYGSVIIQAPERVKLLELWLPFIRKLKPSLDSMIDRDAEFTHKMNEDMCQSIQGAVVSLVLGLPSDDQAEIFAAWMNSEEVRYPDLSEAFEIWCFRTKSAKRRLVGSMDRADNTSVSL